MIRTALNWLAVIALFTFLTAVIVIASMIGAWAWLVYGPGPG